MVPISVCGSNLDRRIMMRYHAGGVECREHFDDVSARSQTFAEAKGGRRANNNGSPACDGLPLVQRGPETPLFGAAQQIDRHGPFDLVGIEKPDEIFRAVDLLPVDGEQDIA